MKDENKMCLSLKLIISAISTTSILNLSHVARILISCIDITHSNIILKKMNKVLLMFFVSSNLNVCSYNSKNFTSNFAPVIL